MKTLIVTTCKDALWFPALPPDIGRAAIPWEAEQICREYGRLVLIGDLPEESYFSVPFLMHPRACVFLWDVVSNPTSPNPETLERLKPYYPVYSFDPADCEAYGLRPAPTCYWPRALPAPRETTGVLFVGREHGRAQALRALGRLCAGEGVPANIHVFGPEGGAPKELCLAWIRTLAADKKLIAHGRRPVAGCCCSAFDMIMLLSCLDPHGSGWALAWREIESFRHSMPHLDLDALARLELNEPDSIEASLDYLAGALRMCDAERARLELAALDERADKQGIRPQLRRLLRARFPRLELLPEL